MANEFADNQEQALNRYFDGQMTPEERAAFEEAARNDTDLARQIEMQGRVDDSLRSMFAPPDDLESRFVLPETPVIAHLPRTPSRMWVRLALAAVLALSAVGAWFTYRPGSSTRSPYEPLSLTEVFSVVEAKNWHPSTVCTSDEAFRSFAHKQIGREVLVVQTCTLSALGWEYGQWLLSEPTAVVLMRDGDEHVMVLMGELKGHNPPEIDATSDLRVYRRDLAPIVLYEISRLDEPHTLDAFYLPESE